MRSTHLFNDGWCFAPEIIDAFTLDERFSPVTLPHNTVELPHTNFDDSIYQFVSTYNKQFRLPEALNGRRVYLDFEGAMTASRVTLNGHAFPEYRGGYTPFSFDITDYVIEDGENQLTVHLDSTERPDIPPFGGRIDYLTYSGIYRDVHLRYVAPVHISDVFIKTHGLLVSDEKVEMEVTLRNQTDEAQKIALVGKLEFWRDEMATAEIPPQGSITLTLWSDLRDYPKKNFLWSPDAPNLHMFEFRLFAEAGFSGLDEVQYDHLDLRTGFREIAFTEEGFYLNGQKMKLIGLNRHQTYPYIGQAAPPRLQRRDAEIVKFDLGCNIVRTSHYPQSRHFLDRCDEIGLLVLEEIPGWQHIGDEYWQQVSLRDVGAMIERDRNRPSIVLWSVRINESLDDHDFYSATNALARRLDPTRPTTGVRYFQDSEFLEDVFGFNDFSNSVQAPKNKPHLITEFNGHMFPTKTFDNEERQMEHALRHARVQDLQFGREDVLGAIGWCAWDYNTHKDFGSGDRVCYHGVMDMFRLPKYAAHVYASQVNPSHKIVMEAATIWSIGDRSAGGNDPVVVLSNVDEIEMYVGDSLHGRFRPDREQFPSLPHPPFVMPIELIWGQAYGDLRLVGFVNGEAVAEQKIALHGLPHKLTLQADSDTLHADGADMTWLWFKLVGLFGNRLPYGISVVSFEIEGPGELIGENPFPLVGGQAGLFVKAGKEPGIIRVRASTPRLDPVEVEIRVE